MSPEVVDLASEARAVVVEGAGLHTGSWARVTLCPHPGPVRLSVGGVDARIDELSVAGTKWATTVELPTAHPNAHLSATLRVATVEHLFAALGGLGIRNGVMLCVEGSEVPLLDGGAAKWCEHLADLGLSPVAPPLRVVRDGVIHVDSSRYEFGVAKSIDVEVQFETDDERVMPKARWLGDAGDFRLRIAPARTFATSADLGRLSEAGLARGVDPSAVILLAPDAIHCVAPYSPDEPARHKLLDLIGDAYLCGGPPVGRLCARRPGHSANARALRLAHAQGILVLD